MVRIDKSKTPTPPILDANGKGPEATQGLIKAALRGESEFEFDRNIYAHLSVKETLVSLQKGKCCFCQGSVIDTSHGDVEHFRPKAGYRQSDSQPLQKPGYYWLAYDFSNLFFACEKCNEVYKRNYFPLADESVRATSHSVNCSIEDNLILHPEKDNPEDHITFVGELVKAKDGSVKGIETIKRTGLDRPKLDDSRLAHLETLLILAKLARSDNEYADEARIHFKKISKPGHLFSAMVRANFPDLV